MSRAPGSVDDTDALTPGFMALAERLTSRKPTVAYAYDVADW